MIFEDNKIVIVGKGGSGKDFLRKKFQARGFKYCINYTSRPIRTNEKDGVDYHYVDKQHFIDFSHHFYDMDEFIGWKYGYKKIDFDRCNLFVMTPRGIKRLKPEDREKCFIIWVDPDREVLRERLTGRNDADSAERRLKTDEEDFSDFLDYDIRIKNEDF